MIEQIDEMLAHYYSIRLKLSTMKKIKAYKLTFPEIQLSPGEITVLDEIITIAIGQLEAIRYKEINRIHAGGLKQKKQGGE